MKKMKTLLAEAKRAAASRKFIVKYESELTFDYGNFTLFCDNLAWETNAESSAPVIRDIVMEEIDPKFNRDKPFTFRGFDCID